MRKNKIKYFIHSKAHLLLILLVLSILGIILLVGVSYYHGIKIFWNDFTTKSYGFRVYVASLKDGVDKNEFIKEIKNNQHIEDAFLYSEYSGYGVFNDFVTDDINGEVQIIGSIPGTKKILYGKDIGDEYNGIICPSNFLPDSTIYNSNSFNSENQINLENKLEKLITVNYLKKENIQFKLVGIFDGKFDYSNPNTCYTNHKIIKQLNDKHQPSLDENMLGIYLMFNDRENIDSVLEDYDEIVELYPTRFINKETGNVAIKLISIMSIVLIIIISVINYLIYSRKIKREYRNIGIKLMLGFNELMIKKKYYKETLILDSIAILISLLISLILIPNFVTLFLSKDPILSLITIKFKFYSLLICISLIYIPTLVSLSLALKKIEQIDVCNIIYE